MSFRNSLCVGAAALALAPAIAIEAQAQETTSAIRGQIVDQTGAAVSGAAVTVEHTPTGSVSTSTTGSGGVFRDGNLRVGGPYTVTVEAPGYQTTVAENVFLSLGETYDLSLTLMGGEDVVVVTGSAINVVETAIGPSATFSQEVLNTAPAINRSLGDIVRLDPRIYLDEAFVDSIQCAGANPRFNSLTLDGVRMNDAFGLNSNGFPTERQPFSYDAIEQVAVELAPFDVQYGGFSACNINAVTKTGGNEFHGGLFFDYTDDGLQGDSLEGNSVFVAPFDEKRYGVYVGGPIIQDNLFFFVSYEKLEGANTFDNGYVGSNAANELPGFTQADYDEILDIAQNVYNYDPGQLATSFPNEDEKLLVKLDWDITNDHRASFVYNYNDGFNISASDDDADEFEYSNHFYERGAELNSYVGSLYSNWTDNLSTELRLGYLKLDNRQNSLAAASGFGEIQIDVNGNTIYLGQDDSRHANDLSYDTLTGLARATYSWNQHNFTAGYEMEQVDVFNVFVQHVDTQIEFDSIADFRNGVFSAIEYANAPSGDPNDAAAEWGYTVHTIYGQDEFELVPNLTVTAGLRYDWYASDDLPEENPNFVADYGFSNAQNLDGEGLLQPRFGFQWEATDALSVRGGFGLYSGGNPNVWLSNNYSANNVLQYTVDEGIYEDANGDLPAGLSVFDLNYAMNDGPGGPGYGVPVEMADAVANQSGSNFEINYLDPDFDIPSEWKFALGATYDWDTGMGGLFGGMYQFNADLLYTISKDPAVISHADLVLDGTLVAGVPDFSSPAADSFALTNADASPESFNASVSVAKQFDFGLDAMIGYAYSDAKEVQPMTSSVAFSNYNNRAYLNPEASEIATSNYNIEHRVTALLDYEFEWARDFTSIFSVFFSANEGRPYSYTFAANSLLGFTPFQGADSSLLYVPTGPSDPNVVFGPGFDQAAFFNFVEENGLDEFAGQIAPRNAFTSDWWTKVDLKFEQKFPSFIEGHSLSGFIIVDNFTNMLDDDWGVLKEASFPRINGMVDASLTNNGTQFLFEDFDANQVIEPRVGRASLWSVRIGARYEF